jgi:hypothetical protein
MWLMSSGDRSMAVDDRRKRKRVAVHWRVRLFRQPGTQWVETTTENLSSEGLYCICEEPFKPGERLECVILGPGESFGSAEPLFRLQCHVIVRRLEHLPEGFGLGCHIEDFAVATDSPLLAM